MPSQGELLARVEQLGESGAGYMSLESSSSSSGVEDTPVIQRWLAISERLQINRQQTGSYAAFIASLSDQVC